MSTHAPWIDSMRHAQVLEVAQALKLPTAKPRGASGGSVYGCPGCGSETRHTKSEPAKHARGAIGVTKDGHGWRCFQCDESGDAIDLVSWVLAGKRYRDLPDHGRADVRRWCERWTHSADLTQLTAAPAVERSPEPPSYPPLAEVHALWAACVRVDVDEGVRDYLALRRLSATQIADMDLARALPMDAAVPKWARRWQSSGHRLIVPMHDSRAEMRSVLARAVVPAERKSLAPAGFQRVGIVMLCPFARWLVRAATFPDWWPGHTALRLIVAEGEIDFLTWITEFSESAECAPATIGVVQGAWSSDIAARIPDGATVLIATHNDPPGDGYAAHVVQTLRGRPKLRLERWDAAEGSP